MTYLVLLRDVVRLQPLSPGSQRKANLPTVNWTPIVLRFKHVPVTANAEREEAGWKGVGRNKQQEGEERKGTGWERKGRLKCMIVASLCQALLPNSAPMFPFSLCQLLKCEIPPRHLHVCRETVFQHVA